MLPTWLWQHLTEKKSFQKVEFLDISAFLHVFHSFAIHQNFCSQTHKYPFYFITHTFHPNHTNPHRTSHKPSQGHLATSKPWICTLRFMAVKWRFTEGNAVIGSAKPQGSGGGTPLEPWQPWSSRHWVHSVNGYFAAMHPNVPTTTIITQISFPQPHTI